MDLFDDLLTDYRSSTGPSTTEQIESATAMLGMHSPPDLTRFLVSRGPGEGFVGAGGYLTITPPEGWVDKHTILEAAINWPGLLIFGSNGGGEFFAFDEAAGMYVEVDAIGDPDRRPLGRSFGEFLRCIADQR